LSRNFRSPSATSWLDVMHQCDHIGRNFDIWEKHCLKPQTKHLSMYVQGCQIILVKYFNRGKMYQTTKNIPKEHKVYQMAMRLSEPAKN
jgi:hypothetical protein